MWKLHKARVDLAFIVNPFYLYCLGFSLAIFLYLWGWSNIFPQLSSGLFLFLLGSFVLFILTGCSYGKIKLNPLDLPVSGLFFNDIIFWLIILLGFLNIIFMGYLPIMDRSQNYHEFGVPVLDPVFNTLSIFFSVFFFQTYLQKKKKRLLFYIFIILIIQILLFRRSTIIWILTSSSFLFLLYKRKINLIFIIAAIISIPVLSYFFGLYGNTRSNLDKSSVMYDFGASDTFIESGINHNHYMTYLYVSSPLANLQENVKNGNGFLNRRAIKDFFFYCLVPVSFTIRLDKTLNLTPPECNLITPNLIVGTLFMISFYTMGWLGMIIMLGFLFVFLFLCLYIINKWDTFRITTSVILSTTVSLSIFSNFLNRLDVIIMLFVYPVLFHFILIQRGRVPVFLLNAKC